MTDPDKELAKLRQLCPEAELWTEGGRHVVFLPGVDFPANGDRATCDLLLWPFERDGYENRLFLSAAVAAPRATNWGVFNIQGRTWHACSWRGVPNTLPWIQILLNHLGAFR